VRGPHVTQSGVSDYCTITYRVQPLIYIERLQPCITLLQIHMGPMSAYIGLLQTDMRPLSVHMPPLQIHMGVMSIHITRLQTDMGLLSIHTGLVQTRNGPLQTSCGRLSICITPMEVDIRPLQPANRPYFPCTPVSRRPRCVQRIRYRRAVLVRAALHRIPLTR